MNSNFSFKLETSHVSFLSISDLQRITYMGRSQESFNKKEREKKKKKRKQEKRERREQKKLQEKTPVEFVYADEFGNLSTTPPDKNKKSEIKASDIQLVPQKKTIKDRPIYLRDGIIKHMDVDKGYGFIRDADTSQSYFVHSSELYDGVKLNDKVIFKVGKGPKGPIAIEVRPLK